MEFASEYNCHCLLRLETGREITLDQLTQTRTYAGLLEGTPNSASNDRQLQWALERAKRGNEHLGEPFLIEPERRDYHLEQGDMRDVVDRQQDRPVEMKHIPEWLPEIECVAVFHSLRPARDKTRDASSLVVVWYQDDFGLDPVALERLRMVDWDRHAIDWEW